VRNLTAAACVMAFFIGYGAVEAKTSRQGMFKYSAGQTWKVEETSVMQGMPPSRSTMEIKVLKVLPGGIALSSWKPVKIETGPSLDKLTPLAKSPMLNQQFHRLLAPNGEQFQVQGPQVTDVEAAIESSMMSDADPIPGKPLKIGEKVQLKLADQTWTVTRLADDKVNDVPCAVYESKLSSMTRTTCFDHSSSMMLRRKISQPGAEMTVVRLK